MKKFISVAIAALFVIWAFGGCSSSNSTAAPSLAPTSSTASASSASSANPNVANYPVKDIEMVIPYNAGGGFDLQARIIARYMPDHLPKNVNIIPRNVPGAVDIVGITEVFNSKPDGYTIGILSLGNSINAEYLNPNPTITYSLTDFEFIGCWAVDVNAIGFTDDIKATTWDELVALSKESPIRFGTAGQGGTMHIDPLVISMCTDADFSFIHYEGNAQIVPALGRGEVSGQQGSLNAIVRQAEQGLGRVFCIMSEERLPNYPDYPTALEIGMPKEQFEKIMNFPFFSTARVFYAPPNMDPELLQILRQAFWDTVNDERVIKEFRDTKDLLDPLTGEETVALIERKLAGLSAAGGDDIIEAVREASRQ